MIKAWNAKTNQKYDNVITVFKLKSKHIYAINLHIYVTDINQSDLANIHVLYIYKTCAT